MIIDGNNPYVEPSFSFSNRAKRQIWNTVWLFLFRPSPKIFHRWRNFLLKTFGARLGMHVHIHPSVKVWAPWNFHVGDFVGIGEGVNVYCMDRVKLGDYAVISQGTHLCGGSHDFNSPNFQLKAAPIEIGRRVWLCADSFIGLGVSVPEGTVIGARSVVAKSIAEPWTVWAGVPARKIGIRDHKMVLK